MKRDKNTFIQTHWSNRHSSRRHATPPSEEEWLESSSEFHPLNEPSEEKTDDARKNTLFTPQVDGEENPFPVFSSPPEVVDREVKKETNRKMVDPANEMRRRLSSKRRHSSPARKGEDPPFSEKVSEPKEHLLKEFLSMLDESVDSVYINENASFPEAFPGMVEEGPEPEPENDEGYPILSDIVYSFENGSTGDFNSFKDYYFSQKDMEQNPIFSEVSAMLEEGEGTKEEVEPLVDLHEVLPLSESFSEILEKNLCKETIQDGITFLENLFQEKLKEEDLPHHFCEKEPPVIIRVPVLLADMELDLDVNETIRVAGVSQILTVDVNLHSLKTVVLPTAGTVFISGILMADLKYVKDSSRQTIHSLKFPVYWDDVAEVKWLKLPDLPQSFKHEFSFNQGKENSLHVEDCQKLSQPITDDVKGTHFVWYSSLADEEVTVQGNGHIRISLSQEQYVRIHK